MSSESTIAFKAQSCSNLFHECIEKIFNRDVLRIFEDEQRRLRIWASRLKVVARPRVNLDAQLAPIQHKEIRQMVVVLLDLMKNNLALALKTTTANKDQEFLKQKLKAPLFGIDGSLKRLERLASAILYATEASLHRRVYKYAQKNADPEFERQVWLVLNSRFPQVVSSFDIARMQQLSSDLATESSSETTYINSDIFSGLFRALFKTIIFRHYRMIYERERRQKDLNPPPLPEQEESPEVPIDQELPAPEKPSMGEPKAPVVKPALKNIQDNKSESTSPNTIDGARLKANIENPEGQESQSGDETYSASESGQVIYPRPPQFPEGAEKGICTLCGQELPIDTFKDAEWIRHVGEDVKPYVCIAEECLQNPQYFAKGRQWKKHMRKIHTTQWIRSLHNPSIWKCPMKHAKSISFSLREDLIQHLQQNHPELTQKDQQNLVNISEIPIPRPIDECPICGDKHEPPKKPPPKDEEESEGEVTVPPKSETSKKKNARFDIPESSSESESEQHEADDEAIQAQAIRARDHNRIETNIGQHLKSLAFFFSNRLTRDLDIESDDAQGSSVDSDEDEDDRVLFPNPADIEDDSPELPVFLSLVQGPIEGQSCLSCVEENLTELYVLWEGSRRPLGPNLPAEELECIFPKKSSAEKIPSHGVVYAALGIVVLEICNSVYSQDAFNQDVSPSVTLRQFLRLLNQFFSSDDIAKYKDDFILSVDGYAKQVAEAALILLGSVDLFELNSIEMNLPSSALKQKDTINSIKEDLQFRIHLMHMEDKIAHDVYTEDVIKGLHIGSFFLELVRAAVDAVVITRNSDIFTAVKRTIKAGKGYDITVPTDESELYKIAWIATLAIDRAVATALLDERHYEPNGFVQNLTDPNLYSWGRMGDHRIVIASLPTKNYSSATLNSLLASLPHIRIALSVGIGSAIPRPDQDRDIRLGDVVVSNGIVEYDLGRAKSNNDWVPQTMLNTPPNMLLNALSSLQAEHKINSSKIPSHLEDIWKAFPLMKNPSDQESGYIHQGVENDRLFSSSEYDEATGETRDKEVERPVRDSMNPKIHYGIIASGKKVINDATVRDKIAEMTGPQCICIEREAAGVIGKVPCLVIRGICDYADSHNYAQWQRYAAATAAAYAKELLERVSQKELENTRPVMEPLELKQDSENIQVTAPEDSDTVLPGIATIEEVKLDQVLRRIDASDPESDKEEIEFSQGPLLRDCYSWILDNNTFREFLDSPNSQLLWIQGDLGTGKTMLTCGIIDELQKEIKDPILYFFCNENSRKCNNAASVLCGFLRLLIMKHPSLFELVRDELDSAAYMSNPRYSWEYWKRVFQEVIQSPTLQGTILIVDSLDGCTFDRDLLVEYLKELRNTTTTNIKSIVSSRPQPTFGGLLSNTEIEGVIRLDLTPNLISDAVNSYISHQTKGLSLLKKYPPDITETIQKHLIDHSEASFLWVYLVCHHLMCVKTLEAIDALKTVPPDLKHFYIHMLKIIEAMQDAMFLKEILALNLLVYRPISLEQLELFLKPAIGGFVMGSVEEDVLKCSSFLTVRNNHVVDFIHQSAKQFLLEQGANTLFPIGKTEQHSAMFEAAIAMAAREFQQDSYSLQDPGTLTKDVEIQQSKRIHSIRYSIMHWSYHLDQCQSMIPPYGNAFVDSGSIDQFLRNDYLHWLESLSFLELVPESIKSMTMLVKIASQSGQSLGISEHLHQLILDASTFLRHFQSIITIAPLQVYASAMIFSPKNSLIRQMYMPHASTGISLKSSMKNDWHDDTTEHKCAVEAVTFSPDGQYIASGSVDGMIKIWNSDTGSCKLTLQDHDDRIDDVEFAPNNQLIASASQHGTLRLWDLTTGHCTHETEFDSTRFTSLSFSPDGMRLALLGTSQILDIQSHEMTTIEGDYDWIKFTTPDDVDDVDVQQNIVGYWIRRDGKQILLLPKEYEPASFDVKKSMVVIGCESGAVIILELTKEF